MKKFPFLYIALLYVFSTKDKIIFYMQQFASIIIALCIAVIITSFSLMNGFNTQITAKILEKNSAITIISQIDGQNVKSDLISFNNGFEQLSIQNNNIRKIEHLRTQKTFIILGDNEYSVGDSNNYPYIYEDPNQKTPIMINEKLLSTLKKNNITHFSIVDPNSYNSLIGGLSRQKRYYNYELNSNTENNIVISLSSDEYQKLFHNTNYNQVNIDLKDIQKTLATSYELKKQLQNQSVKLISWNEISPELFNALELQKKILLLVYIIIFTLLCAIIISTNVSFFKDKRKDWALIKILDIDKYAVEKIFLYKNIISFLLSTLTGILLGITLTIHSNEILHFLNYMIGNNIPIENMFGAAKLSYEFHLLDIFKIVSFSFLIFFINFIILLCIFRKENVANFLKAP